jgi:type IV secretion system protein VirB4
MVALRRFRATGPSFADLVPYAGLIDNGVMLLKDGSLMAGWYFAGPDSESATDLERNELARQINAVLARMGSGWIIQVEAVRVPTVDYPTQDRSHFQDPVTRAIDDERRAHFAREQGHFESKHAIILTYRPLESKRSSLSKYVYTDEESRKRSYADTVLLIFKNAVREIGQYLGNTLSIRRMQTVETAERGEGRTLRRAPAVCPLLHYRRESSGPSPRCADVSRLGRDGRAGARPDAAC